VHSYRELDLEIVRNILTHRLDDLRAFARLLLKLALPASFCTSSEKRALASANQAACSSG
jgi:hypothetical protein